MPYALESDDLRQEIRKDVAGTIRFWPKVDGENVLADNGATYAVYDMDGNALSSGTVNPTNVSAGVDRFDITITAGDADDYGEDYRVDLTWTHTGGNTYFDRVYFDVVLYPYGQPSISLNDLQEERADVDRVLTRIGERLGLTSGSEAEEAAGYFAIRARTELDALIRDAATQLGTIRPALILSRERLNRVERKIAMRLIYASIAKAPLDGEDEASALYRYYAEEADRAWRSVGPLKYDQDQEGTVDSEVTGIGKSIFTRRVQG